MVDLLYSLLLNNNFIGTFNLKTLFLLSVDRINISLIILIKIKKSYFFNKSIICDIFIK